MIKNTEAWNEAAELPRFATHRRYRAKSAMRLAPPKRGRRKRHKSMRFEMIGALGFAMLILSLSPALAQTLRCDITSRQYCSKDGCEQVGATVWNVIDLYRQTFSRCDHAGCDTYPATLTEVAEFMIIDMPGHGLIAKLAMSGGDFMEVATVENTAYMSFGKCR